MQVIRRLASIALAVGACAALAPTRAAADAMAVVAVAESPGPGADLVAATERLRAALAARAAGVLDARALRERMFGDPPASLEALDRAYERAVSLHAEGDFEGSVRALRAHVAELERWPGAEQHARWIRAMLRLARSEQVVGRRSEAQAVVERLVRIEPDVVVDDEMYPPGFVRLVDEVRAALRAQPHHALRIESQPGAHVFVEGRDAGPAPATMRLPAGRYRVVPVSGSGVRGHEETVDLVSDRVAQVDLSVAGYLRPDAGPGLALPEQDRVGRILSTAVWLEVERVVAITVQGTGGGAVAATLYDVRRGTTERTGRVRLAGTAPPPGALEALADYLLTGRHSALVDTGPVSLALAGNAADMPLGASLRADEPHRGSRVLGWTAVGTAAATVVLGAVSIYEAVHAHGLSNQAAAMTEGGVLRPGYSVSEHDNLVYEAQSANDLAVGAGIAAGAMAVTTGVLAYLSYVQTGEVGPFRF